MRLFQYNEEGLSISILTYIKLLNSMDKQKHGKKEKLSIKKAYLKLLLNL